jgi:hypothetical protein
MATFIKGDVVVVPFPFSDLTAARCIVAEMSGYRLYGLTKEERATLAVSAKQRA